MPLDGHSYLIKQGWGGKGTGLRQGALTRPLAIPQKKNLAGLGKDRDEAFPFWDHLFTAAAKSIQVKCLSDDEDIEELSSTAAIKRTSTGIFSTRRPIEGTPAVSGSCTPDLEADLKASKLSLLATAKREAARLGLYSRFFRGPVLGPEIMTEEEKRLTSLVSEALAKQAASQEVMTVNENIEMKMVHESLTLIQTAGSSKKRKPNEESNNQPEDENARRDRKRRKREEKRRKEEEILKGTGDKKKTKIKHEKPCDSSVLARALTERPSSDAMDYHSLSCGNVEAGPSTAPEESKSDAKCRKEEKRRLREEKRNLKELRSAEVESFTREKSDIHIPSSDDKDKSSRKESKTGVEEPIEKSHKKKRKRKQRLENLG